MEDCDSTIIFDATVICIGIFLVILYLYTRARHARGQNIRSKGKVFEAWRSFKEYIKCPFQINKERKGFNETVWMAEKSKLQDELRKEKLEKEEALRRLSSIMSSRLKDSNPNVVDLSDQNRPDKLGEKFFQNFTTIKQCFMVCNDRSGLQLEKLNKNVSDIAMMVTKSFQGRSTFHGDLIQRIKEERKMLACYDAPELAELLPRLRSNIPCLDPSLLQVPPIKAYIQESLKLSWLMVIQDPPMAMVLKPEFFTIENFRTYKTRGKVLRYIVWPALLLQERGPLVMKGVAEFTGVY